MGAHHTKDKGDLGTAKAHADLVEHGFMVLFPATEHAEFDLVAYRAGTFHRVQVKYRSARTGSMTVRFRSVWADRHGTHMKPSDKSEVDVTCIYCPETDACYYRSGARRAARVCLSRLPGDDGSSSRPARHWTLASALRDTRRVLPDRRGRSGQDVVRPRHV